MKSPAIPNMFMGYICLSHKHVLHNSRENEMHILRMMNCTNIGKCWYTIAESGSLWPSSLSLPSSISLFHWQIISVNSKNEEHFIHCFIFLFSVTKNYIESHSVRSSILFFSAYRLLCCKTCVHSLSSYLIFIPLHFSTRLSLFSALLYRMCDTIRFLPIHFFIRWAWIEWTSSSSSDHHHYKLPWTGLFSIRNNGRITTTLLENLCTKKKPYKTNIDGLL